jgi:hypothetical protein
MTEKIKKKRARHGGKRPGAGRPPGKPNQLTFEMKKEAAKYGEEVLKALVDVLRCEETPPNVLVAAAKELLDRGFGKPAQEIDVNADFKLNKDFLENVGTLYLKAMEEARARQRRIDIERGILIEHNK